MNIITATIDDVPRIMECAREFCAIIPDCPLDEAHYTEQWTTLLQEGIGVIFLMEQDGKICGGLGGAHHAELLTGRQIAVELFWYVKPEFRHGTYPLRLLQLFEEWAERNRCVYVNMIHMECSMPETMKEIYVRRGYELFETIYQRRIL